MANQIMLFGISFEDFETSLKTIVQNEVQKIVSGLQPAPETAPEFITRQETARILGISLVTLNDWTKRGVIPAKRIGTRIRYEKTIVYNSLKDIETLKYRRA